MNPAHQRLRALDPAGADAHFRLVVQGEVAAFDGELQIGADVLQPRRARPDLLGVDRGVGAAAILQPGAHRHVGAVQQHLGSGAVRRITRDSGEGIDLQVQLLQADRPPQFGRQARRESVQVRLRPQVRRRDDEAVAAHPRRHVAGTHRGAQAFREIAQHRVGGGVAEGFGDFAEAVQVEAEQRAAAVLRQVAGDAGVQHRAVAQAGQHVVRGDAVDPAIAARNTDNAMSLSSSCPAVLIGWVRSPPAILRIAPLRRATRSSTPRPR